MRLLNPDSNSQSLQGCDRLWDGGEDVIIQLRLASAADRSAIRPHYVLDGETLGRVSKAALLEVARNLGLV
jgi:hypothetical protein